MNNRLTVLLLSFVCSISNTRANDFNSLDCLNQEWLYTSPTQEGKEFDLNNDFDINGDPISCYSFLTPSEVRSFISKLADNVNAQNKFAVAELIRFPLRIALSKTYVSEMGYIKILSFEIQNRDEFLEKYDAIFSENLIESVNCMDLARLNVDSVSGLSIASGRLWFNRTFEGDNQREIKVTSISLDETGYKRWFDQNCKSDSQ